jgi:hypothetical protein
VAYVGFWVNPKSTTRLTCFTACPIPPDCLYLMVCSCQSTAWRHAEAALQLQLLSWTPPTASSLAATSDALQLIGFGSNSGHSNLMAEFAGAADDVGSGLQELRVSGDPTPSSGGNGGSSSSSSSKSIRGARKGRGSKTAAVQPAAAAGGGRSRPSSKPGTAECKPVGDGKQQNSKALGSGYQEPAVWLSAALKLLLHAVHRPLLLRQACSLLSTFLLGQGAVHSAAMFLQLKMGE